MVKITIYVEGGNDQTAAGTADNSQIFREGFSRLFAQKFPENEFDLAIQPIGSVNNAKPYLESIVRKNLEGVILIDLDGPESERQKRLNDNYPNLPTDRIFFMIQEMESWILSQPDKIELHAENQAFIRKKEEQKIANNALLRNKHPEDIKTPSRALNTLFQQYFAIEKKRGGKVRSKPKNYSKTKDGPKIIALLDLSTLTKTFKDAANLVIYISKKSGS